MFEHIYMHCLTCKKVLQRFERAYRVQYQIGINAYDVNGVCSCFVQAPKESLGEHESCRLQYLKASTGSKSILKYVLRSPVPPDTISQRPDELFPLLFAGMDWLRPRRISVKKAQKLRCVSLPALFSRLEFISALASTALWPYCIS